MNPKSTRDILNISQDYARKIYLRLEIDCWFSGSVDLYMHILYFLPQFYEALNFRLNSG